MTESDPKYTNNPYREIALIDDNSHKKNDSKRSHAIKGLK